MEQSFENHSRMVPGFHYVCFGLLSVNLLFSLYQVVRSFSVASVVALGLAVGIILLAWYARVFPLTVQDRVIRLEERLRIMQLCPELSAQAASLSHRQLIALRFASDEEFPALVRKVIDENIRSGKAIKQQIRNWRSDQLRA